MGSSELRHDEVRHGMIRHADADGPPLRVLQALGRLARGRQQEGEGPGGVRLQQPELPGVQQGIAADFGQIPADQREVVVLVGVADAADALQRVLVAHVAAQRVARIRGIGDHPALPDDVHGLADQPRLGVLGVNFEVFGHFAMIRGCNWPSAPTRLNECPETALLEFSP